MKDEQLIEELDGEVLDLGSVSELTEGQPGLNREGNSQSQ